MWIVLQEYFYALQNNIACRALPSTFFRDGISQWQNNITSNIRCPSSFKLNSFLATQVWIWASTVQSPDRRPPRAAEGNCHPLIQNNSASQKGSDLHTIGAYQQCCLISHQAAQILILCLLFTPRWVWWQWARGQTGQSLNTHTGPACRGSSPGWRLAEWTEWRSVRGWRSRLRPHPRHPSPFCFSEQDTHWKWRIYKYRLGSSKAVHFCS